MLPHSNTSRITPPVVNKQTLHSLLLYSYRSVCFPCLLTYPEIMTTVPTDIHRSQSRFLIFSLCILDVSSISVAGAPPYKQQRDSRNSRQDALTSSLKITDCNQVKTHALPCFSKQTREIIGYRRNIVVEHGRLESKGLVLPEDQRSLI